MTHPGYPSPAGAGPRGTSSRRAGRNTGRIGVYAHSVSETPVVVISLAAGNYPAASVAGAFLPLSGQRVRVVPSAAGVNLARSDSPATEGYLK
jgi:hypothetical protein